MAQIMHMEHSFWLEEARLSCEQDMAPIVDEALIVAEALGQLAPGLRCLRLCTLDLNIIVQYEELFTTTVVTQKHIRLI
ncbi:hypothetical protein TNCV_2004261 [Trichonephila clavipes]|nr:hypothetical protein TNCV_2004261 [Trichonephila clavipes]